MAVNKRKAGWNSSLQTDIVGHESQRCLDFVGPTKQVLSLELQKNLSDVMRLNI